MTDPYRYGKAEEILAEIERSPVLSHGKEKVYGSIP